MSDKRIVVIAAGGTGGHLYPGLALAYELRQRNIEPVFIVKNGDACTDILSRESFRFYKIPAMGYPRRSVFRMFKFISDNIKGYFAVKKILRTLNPGFVYGMGGYVSVPVLAAAWRYKIPAAIHEQNVIPGLANRMLSAFVKTITLSFKETAKYFDVQKVKLTGTPIRAELFESTHIDACRKLGLDPEKFTVLVFGGSQGAQTLNGHIESSLSQMRQEKTRVQFIHIVGKQALPQFKAAYESNQVKAVVLSYLDAIGDAYAAADLVLSRSGAMTVAELKALNKTAILIPFPFATDDHQYHNALVLINTGQAKVVREKDVTANFLVKEISEHFRQFKGHIEHPSKPQHLPQALLADLVETSL